MATGELYIRPSADIFLGHPVYPESFEAGYLAINDKTSDHKETYIGFVTASEACSYTSKFKMSCEDKVKIINVSSVRIGGYGENQRGTDSSWTNLNFYIGDQLISNVEAGNQVVDLDSYTRCYVEGVDVGETFWHANHELSLMIAAINSAIKANGGGLPEISVEITNSTDGENNGTKNIAESWVSQLFLKIECEYQADIGIHRKVGGEYKAATSAYRKTNGSWVEIPEEECKTILQNSFITK